jgi:hypothetical protein
MTAFKLCALASLCAIAAAAAAGYEWDVDMPENGRNAKLIDRAKQIIDKGIGVTNPGANTVETWVNQNMS